MRPLRALRVKAKVATQFLVAFCVATTLAYLSWRFWPGWDVVGDFVSWPLRMMK